MRPMLSVKEVAELLGLSSTAVELRIREGLLPYVRVGKNGRVFLAEDLQAIGLDVLGRRKKGPQPTQETGAHLGRLCRRSHDHDGTGQSLRNRRRQCIECSRLLAIEQRLQPDYLARQRREHRGRYLSKRRMVELETAYRRATEAG